MHLCSDLAELYGMSLIRSRIADTCREHDSEEHYCYTPLADPSSEIRLVRLQPSSDSRSHNNIPQCTLTHTSIDANPTYTALSYCWGDPNDSTSILVDGKCKSVTRSLAAFLRQASSLLSDGIIDSPVFWIDAISIWQDNAAEKSRQVQIMGEIFSKATTVTVWLGPSSEDSHPAFRFLQDLSETYDEFDDQLLLVDKSKSSKTAYQWLSYIRNHYDDTFAALQNLLHRPWWRRLWVQQEVALARVERTSMICGSAVIPWRQVVLAELTLHRMFMLIIEHPDLQPYGTISGVQELEQEMIRIVQEMVRVCRNSYGHLWPDDKSYRYELADHLILNAVSSSIRVEATLPVDYIHSILGISADIKAAREALTVDYSKTPEDVFINAAQYLFKHHGATMLGLCGLDSGGNLSLPSWAVNWSSPLQRLSLDWRRDVFGPRVAPKLYSSSGSHTQFFFRISGSRLLLKGIEIDSISEHGIMSKLFPNANSNYSDYLHWSQGWLQSYATFQKTVLGDRVSSLHDVLWKLPIADQESNLFTNITSRASNSLKDCYTELFKAAQNEDYVAPPKALSQYGPVMDLVASNRMPFVSVNGRIGLGPNTMQGADKVFLIAGCQSPFVLRDAGNGEFRIVGDAYIDGIMDGEMVDDNTVFEDLVVV